MSENDWNSRVIAKQKFNSELFAIDLWEEEEKAANQSSETEKSIQSRVWR